MTNRQVVGVGIDGGTAAGPTDFDSLIDGFANCRGGGWGPVAARPAAGYLKVTRRVAVGSRPERRRTGDVHPPAGQADRALLRKGLHYAGRQRQRRVQHAITTLVTFCGK
eukprot:scaffold534822_cov39-Prasinocladus_malaysianus.AAC.2